MQAEQRPNAEQRGHVDKDINLILLVSVVALILNIWLQPGKLLLNTSIALPLRTLVMLVAQFCLMGLGTLIILIWRGEALPAYGLRRDNFFQSLCLSLVAFLPTLCLLFVRGAHTYYPMANVMTVGEWVAKGFPLALVGVLPTMFVWGLIQAICYCVLSDKLDKSDPVANPWVRMGPLYCTLFYLVINGYGFSLNRLPELLMTMVTVWGLMQARRISGNSWGMIVVFSLLLNSFL